MLPSLLYQSEDSIWRLAVPSTLLYAIPQLRVSPPAGIKSKSNVPALLEMEMNQNVTLDSGRNTAASFRKVERMLARRQRGAAAAKD